MNAIVEWYPLQCRAMVDIKQPLELEHRDRRSVYPSHALSSNYERNELLYHVVWDS